MSKNYLSWASTQSLSAIKTEASNTQLLTTDADEKVQIKKIQDIEADSCMHIDLDTPLVSRTTSISITLTNEPTTESSSSQVKQNPKKSYQHCKKKHHNHSHVTPKKCVGKRLKIITASKNQSTKSTCLDSTQSSTIVSSKSNGVSQTTDQQVPLTIQQGTNNKSDLSTKNQEKTNQGNIPLQTIENKLVSQRSASVDEAQVGNCSSMICSQCAPATFTTCCVPATQQVCYQEDYCVPPATICCEPSSYVIEQCEPVVCCPPQEQQILVCNEPTPSQAYICSTPSTNCVQQQYICVDNRSNLSLCQPVTTTPCNQSYLCVPQTPLQGNANIIIQQAQQIPSVQVIQPPQTPTAKYLHIASATPQVIQTVDVPINQVVQPQQTVQIIAPTVAASPQILYQRPYDVVALPAQNQQLVAASPVVSLSQPSYAPMRTASPMPARPNPVLFRSALNRVVAQRTGLPLPPSYQVAIPASQPAIIRPNAPLSIAGPAGPVFNTGACVQKSSSLPIVPLTPGGLLIPFQPSQDVPSGKFPRTNAFRSNLKTFDDIRRQIQHRGQLLADLQQLMNSEQASLPPVRSRNTPSSSLPPLTPTSPPTSNPYRSNLPPTYAAPYASNPTRPQSDYALNPSLQPTTNRPQTPFTSGNIFGSSSSSSSSRSSASSTDPRKTNQAPSAVYAQPSFTGPRGESLL